MKIINWDPIDPIDPIDSSHHRCKSSSSNSEKRGKPPKLNKGNLKKSIASSIHLPRQSKPEKLTLILKRREEEEKNINPIQYRSLDSLAFRKGKQLNQTQNHGLRRQSTDALSLCDFNLSKIELTKYSGKREKELLASKKNGNRGSLPILSNAQISKNFTFYLKSVELGIPVKLKDWLPTLELGMCFYLIIRV